MAKIGCFIVNYMYRDFVDWAIQSVLRQTRKPDFLVFIDDHSEDDSVELVKKYFPEIKWDSFVVNESNLGTVKTANLGAKICGEAGCDYICCLSADDMLHKDFFLKTEKALDSSPDNVGFAYTHVRRIGDENQYDIHPEWNKELLQRGNFVHGSALIKFDCWDSVGGLPEGYPREEDWAMFKGMADLGWKGVLVPEALLYWRKHKLFQRTTNFNESGAKRLERWQRIKNGKR